MGRFFTILKNHLYVLMGYIDEVSSRMRRFFTILENHFYVLIGYIDEMSSRIDGSSQF